MKKKSNYKPVAGNMASEREKSLEILSKLAKPKEVLDVKKSVNLHMASTEEKRSHKSLYTKTIVMSVQQQIALGLMCIFPPPPPSCMQEGLEEASAEEQGRTSTGKETQGNGRWWQKQVQEGRRKEGRGRERGRGREKRRRRKGRERTSHVIGSKGWENKKVVINNVIVLCVSHLRMSSSAGGNWCKFHFCLLWPLFLSTVTLGLSLAAERVPP